MNIQITKLEENLVKYKDLDSEVEFMIAKDSMGTQICSRGRFFPDSRDFKSIENAQTFLSYDSNLKEAIEFFKLSPEPGLGESLFLIFSGMMEHELNEEI